MTSGCPISRRCQTFGNFRCFFRQISLSEAIMLKRFSRSWQQLRQGRPGHRFRDRYHRHQRSKESNGWMGRIVHLVLAIVAVAIGVVLVFIPGPAILFFFIAGALLASDWLWMARVLDWGEVRLRSLWR